MLGCFHTYKLDYWQRTSSAIFLFSLWTTNKLFWGLKLERKTHTSCLAGKSDCLLRCTIMIIHCPVLVPSVLELISVRTSWSWLTVLYSISRQANSVFVTRNLGADLWQFLILCGFYTQVNIWLFGSNFFVTHIHVTKLQMYLEQAHPTKLPLFFLQ